MSEVKDDPHNQGNLGWIYYLKERFNQIGKSYLRELQSKSIKVANHYSANIKQYRDVEFKAAIAYSSQMSSKDKQYITRSEISGLNLK